MKRRTIFIIVWAFLCVLLAIVLGMIVRKNGNSRCREIQISINYPSDDHFITEQDIRDSIALMVDTARGIRLSGIDIETLERMICDNPYIARAEVFTTIDGIVRVEVQQRKPIVRVQNSIRQNFYISDDGRLMLLKQGKAARVLFASGNISEYYWEGMRLDAGCNKNDTAIIKTTLYKIFRLAQYISKDKFLDAQIEQIYVNRNGDITLIPMVGSHVIIFGDIDNMEEKFEKLMVFYKQGFPQEGWDKYDTINLKYQNQIVCTKI